MPRLCIVYPGICLTTEENLGKRQLEYPESARLISAEGDSLCKLAIADDGLDWPAGPCRPWLSRQATGTILGQRMYLPSCLIRVFPTSTNFESKLAVRALMKIICSNPSQAKVLTRGGDLREAKVDVPVC